MIYRSSAARRREGEFARLVEGSRAGSSAPEPGSATTTATDEELLQLAGLARSLRLLQVQPRTDFRTDLRARLLDAPGPGAMTSPAPPVRPGAGVRRARLVAGLSLTAALGLGGTASASASALPDDPLYDVKRGVERVQLYLAVTDQRRGRLHLAAAGTRLSEAQQLLDRSQDTPDASVRVATEQQVEALLGQAATSAVAGEKLLLAAMDLEEEPDPDQLRALDEALTLSHRQVETLAGRLSGAGQQELDEVTEVLSRLDERVHEERERCVACAAAAGPGQNPSQAQAAPAPVPASGAERPSLRSPAPRSPAAVPPEAGTAPSAHDPTQGVLPVPVPPVAEELPTVTGSAAPDRSTSAGPRRPSVAGAPPGGAGGAPSTSGRSSTSSTSSTSLTSPAPSGGARRSPSSAPTTASPTSSPSRSSPTGPPASSASAVTPSAARPSAARPSAARQSLREPSLTGPSLTTRSPAAPAASVLPTAGPVEKIAPSVAPPTCLRPTALRGLTSPAPAPAGTSTSTGTTAGSTTPAGSATSPAGGTTTTPAGPIGGSGPVSVSPTGVPGSACAAEDGSGSPVPTPSSNRR